jgi:hypothetical protein
MVMERPVLLIPERMMADPDAEHVSQLRASIRRAQRKRDGERQEYGLNAPDYHWSAPRRR